MKNGVYTNIFILEDDEDRMKYMMDWIDKQYDQTDAPLVVHSVDAKDAMEVLSRKEHEWDFIMLDHDLGGETFVSSSEFNTGHTVARFIRDNDIKCGYGLVHSLNYDGCTEMLYLLPHFIRLPVSTLVKLSLEHIKNWMDRQRELND